MSTLVVVPCGKAKVWDKRPRRGPTPASVVYTGGLFRANKKYALRFADEWVILSAKYGLIHPDFVIPENYDTSFVAGVDCVSTKTLCLQADQLRLDRHSRVIGLGGKEYRSRVSLVFGDKASFPFAGLSIGRTIQAVNRLLDTRQGFFS